MAKPSCDRHKKHNAECGECLKLYLTVSKPRMGVQPTKVFKDKSKYTRKLKHQKGRNDPFTKVFLNHISKKR